MDVLDDHSEDGKERIHCGGGARFGARWQKPRSKSHHQLLMDSVGNGNGNGNGGVDGDDTSEDQEILPLPDYERLSQSARLSDDPDPKNPLLPEYPAAFPPLPPPMPRPQKKPAAWRLIDYVRSRNRSSGISSDGDSRSSDGEKEDDGGGGEKNKKRSSWLPDRRWPVQGFSGEEVEDGGGEEGKKEEKIKKRSSWLPDRENRWPVQGFS